MRLAPRAGARFAIQALGPLPLRTPSHPRTVNWRSTGGSGHMDLGLSIVHQIALAHGGGVDVQSSPDGTHFSVRLTCKGS